MPVDAFAVMALRLELSEALEGGRIDKIYMPSKTEIHIAGRAPRGPFRLLLSVHPQRSRAHLTTISRENPPSPPMFCMLLRKHLTGGRFAGLHQPPLERVLHFYIDASDEMGQVSRKTLVIEMIGRHSNIILVDAENRIVDALKRVDYDMSERGVLPGLFYRDPPGQGKTDPTTVSEADFMALFHLKPPETPLDEWLGNTFTAFSPILCRDMTKSATDSNSLFSQVDDIIDYVKLNSFTPYIIKDGSDFFSLPLKNTPQIQYGGSFSLLLDELYTSRDKTEHLGQRVSALTRTAKNNINKLLKKSGVLKQELLEAQNRESKREQADLLMANLHRVERGAGYVTVEDFYHDNKTVTITLDPRKSPQNNAAALYKSYAKAKNAETALIKQIQQAESDAGYWESVLDQLSRVSNERDIDEIREEVQPRKQRPGKISKVSQPMRFRSSEGIIFRAGRNNRQNDLLTMKMAGKNDIWLHTQKIPGAHVVIESNGAEAGEQTLYEAACVAAWLSAAKTSPKVPVDYTAVKYVKKPGGAKPGMVIYERFKTLLAEPCEALAKRLQQAD